MAWGWMQRTEHAARESLLHLAIGCTPHRVRTAAPDALRGRPLRVLFIREGPLGDLILALGAIRAIAEAHPGTTVDVAATDGNAELLRGLPYVHRVIAFPHDDRRASTAASAVRRRAPYDVVVDGMLVHRHVRTRSIAIMLASRARYWVGESGRRTGWTYNVAVPPAPNGLLHVEREVRLAVPFVAGGARMDPRPRLTLDAERRDWAERLWNDPIRGGPRILVNLSASIAARRWPDERFAEALAHLRQREPEAAIAVVGLPADAPSVHALAHGVRAIAHVPTLGELVALVATADLVLSPNTAVCHIASAFETPLVSLHLRDTAVWWPFATPGRCVESTRREDLLGISSGAVIEALDHAIASLRCPPSANPRDGYAMSLTR